MIDYTGGLLGSIAVLLGLFHRHRNKEGVGLTAPLINAGLILLSELIETADRRFVGAPTLNSRMTAVHPAEALYQASDGWIAVAVRGAEAAAGFVRVLGLPGDLLHSLPSWGDRETRLISTVIEKWSVHEALAKLEAAGVWAEPCLRPLESGIFQDPYLFSAGILQSTPDKALGKVTQFGTFIHFSRSVCRGRGGAANKGEHTKAVLKEVGFEDQVIDTFYTRGVVV